MAATVKATQPKPPRRPAAAAATLRPNQDEAEAIIEIAEDDPAAEPERVPLFKIGDDVYTMLADPPLTLAMQARDVSYDRGAGYAEIFIMREMLGEDAYRTLLATRSLKGAQLNAITQRVTTRLFGALERESPSPRR